MPTCLPGRTSSSWLPSTWLWRVATWNLLSSLFFFLSCVFFLCPLVLFLSSFHPVCPFLSFRLFFFLTGLHSLRVCLSWLLLLAPSNHSIMRRSSMQQNKNTFCLADSSPETHFLRLYLVLLGFTAFQYDTCSIDFSGLDSSFT